MAFDVTEAEFEARVIERSHELPVVVDFWAEWCGPCRVLGPALEDAVAQRAGRVELAKVDVDSNQMLATAFGIRGIPAVKAFKDGKVAAQFTGAVPPARIESFLDQILPSEADEEAASDDEEGLRRALALEPGHPAASRKLARALLRRGERDEAVGLLEGLAGDFEAEGLLARARLESANGTGEPELARAFAAWDDGDHATALEVLQGLVARADDPDRRDLLRRTMVAIFTELGPADPVARDHRRRLAAVLN